LTLAGLRLYTPARWVCGGRGWGFSPERVDSPYAAGFQGEAQEEAVMAMRKKAKKKAPAKKKAAKKKK
jgi:hypothetical protein